MPHRRAGSGRAQSGAVGGSSGTVVGAVTGAALGGLTGNAIGRDLDEKALREGFLACAA